MDAEGQGQGSLGEGRLFQVIQLRTCLQVTLRALPVQVGTVRVGGTHPLERSLSYPPLRLEALPRSIAWPVLLYQGAPGPCLQCTRVAIWRMDTRWRLFTTDCPCRSPSLKTWAEQDIGASSGHSMRCTGQTQAQLNGLLFTRVQVSEM